MSSLRCATTDCWSVQYWFEKTSLNAHCTFVHINNCLIILLLLEDSLFSTTRESILNDEHLICLVWLFWCCYDPVGNTHRYQGL